MINTPDTPAEIYGLYDPRTGALRYIGKANDATKRLKSHLRDASRRDTPVYRWLRKLRADGLAPQMLVLEAAKDWREAERRLIALSRARGDSLLNVADGGDEPFCSPELRKGNAVALNMRIANDPLQWWLREAKRRLVTASKHGYLSESTTAKLRQAAVKRPDLFGCFAFLGGGYANSF